MARLTRLADGVELAMEEPARPDVASRVVEALTEVRELALRLMLLYLHTEFRREVFWLDTVEVFAARTRDGADAALSFSYSEENRPHEEADTRFEVFIRVGIERHEQQFHAVRFAVGFR